MKKKRLLFTILASALTIFTATFFNNTKINTVKADLNYQTYTDFANKQLELNPNTTINEINGINTFQFCIDANYNYKTDGAFKTFNFNFIYNNTQYAAMRFFQNGNSENTEFQTSIQFKKINETSWAMVYNVITENLQNPIIVVNKLKNLPIKIGSPNQDDLTDLVNFFNKNTTEITQEQITNNLSNQISNLNTQINNLTNQNTQLQNQINTLNQQISNISSYSEVIDIPGMMFDIISLPFTFISQAFDLTIFEETPYEINFANLFKGLIATLTVLFIIKLFTSGLDNLGKYEGNFTQNKLNREKIKTEKSQRNVNNAKADKIRSSTKKDK